MLRTVLAVAMLLTSPAAAQEPVKGVPNPETLFTDRNPTLNANKQAALHYTSTWFDMWRFVDSKADEHWDPATKP